MISTIQFEQFFNFVKQQDGKIFKTLHHGQSFLMKLTDGNIVIIPDSTKNPQYPDLQILKNVFNLFQEKRSFRPRDYAHIPGAHACYALPLIKHYLEAHPLA